MLSVVTGSRGFIGTHLVDALVSRGDDVWCLVRRGGGAAGATRPRVREVSVDYDVPGAGLDPDALRDVAVVYHVAGVTKGITAKEFHSANIATTRRLIEALDAGGSRARLVLVSSQAAAGPASSPDAPVRESDPPAPVEPYGASKLAAERLVAASGANFAIARPAVVYGPRDRNFQPLARTLRFRIAVYPGYRDRTVCMIHVRDLVEGFIAVGTRDEALGRTYFLTHPEPVTWRRIYQAMGRAAGGAALEVQLPQSLVNVAARVGDLYGRATGKTGMLNTNKIAMSKPDYWICSPERAETELGFRARIALDDGMRDTYGWYRAAGWA